MDKILLIGATGMVGSAVVGAADGISLTVLARRSVPGLPELLTEVIAPPEEWATKIAAIRPSIVLNALGTTIRQAGSQSAFRAVDHDLVLGVADAAKASGARHFISVSSVGAAARSGNFYLRTKGEVETALSALGFERLDIMRPGLLTGVRTGPARPGEALAMLAAPLTDLMLHGALRRYRSVPAYAVAAAMLALARAGGTGTQIHEHDAIIKLAN